MKNLYCITLQDPNGRMIVYRIIASTMAAAVTAAQTKAGISTEPHTTQKLSDIDFEV